jgi:hypothetical protein
MAAPMTERHRWMAANVAAAFDMIDTQNVVEDVLTEYNNFKKINDFLEGRAKHKHLFIYYQKPDIFNDAGEFVDAKGDAKLFITYGDNDDLRIKSRAVYFLRTVGDQKAVKPEVACDHELLFGEVAAAPLESLATGLNDVFRPLFAHAANTAQDKSCIDWSNVDEEQRTEFLTGFSKFTFDLTEGIRTLSDGIELGVLPVGDVIGGQCPIKTSPQIMRISSSSARTSSISGAVVLSVIWRKPWKGKRKLAIPAREQNWNSGATDSRR